jgi:hypothetical protein
MWLFIAILIHIADYVKSIFSANSIIGPKLIALDNVWKADQPALGNRALTFPRVKEK